MAAKTLTAAGSLSYTGPGSLAARVAFSIPLNYNALSEGVIDVADTTASATAIVVPFGSVAVPCAILVKNTNSQAMGVRVNTAVTNDFEVPAGSALLIVCPTAALITALKVVTTALQSGDGTVEYIVFGD